MKIQSLAGAVAALALASATSSLQAQPTSIPAAPTLPAGHVIALYNSTSTYSNIASINLFESWGGWVGAGLFTVGSYQVPSYYGLNYGGIGFETDPQSVGGCTNLHMDVYTPNGDSFAIRLVDTSGHTADITFTNGSGVITDNTWLGLNFPLSQFQATNPSLNLGAIQQIGLIGNNAGEDSGSDFYLDNIYFAASTNLVAPPPIPVPTNNAATPTRPSSSVVAMYNSSGTYTDVTIGDWDAGWSSAIESSYTITNTGATVLKYNALQYAGVEFYNPNQIDASSCNTMHVDVWTPNANQFGIKLVSLDNGGTQASEVDVLPATGTIVSNQWVSLNIPLSTFLANNATLDITNLQQMLFIDNQGGGGVVGGIFYVDNVYFYSNNVVPPPPSAPTNNAPTPTAASGSVLALYNSSGVYTDAPIDDWNASWSGSSESAFTITNTGNVVLHYGGLQYAGVEFYTPLQLNLTNYNTMHVDVWTPNVNQFGIQLVSLDGGGTQAAQINVTPASGTITSNKWIGLDIPLSSFNAVTPSLDLSDVQQMLWIDNQGGGLTGGIFYIDNVYFYTAATLSAPTLSASVVSGSYHLSFPTVSGHSYTVLYTTNLASGSWQTLSTVSGNGSTLTITNAMTSGNRFYRVSAQ